MRKRRYRVNNKGKAIGRILVLLAGLLIIAGLIFGIVKLIGSGAKKGKGTKELPFAGQLRKIRRAGRKTYMSYAYPVLLPERFDA